MEEMIEMALSGKTKRNGPVLFSEYNRGEGIKTALDLSRDDILFEIKESGLKGRGGAGFPTATKWMLVAAAKSDKKYIVCNADEGEPGTFKDRVLLTERADLVLEGMTIAGHALDDCEVVFGDAIDQLVGLELLNHLLGVDCFRKSTAAGASDHQDSGYFPQHIV